MDPDLQAWLDVFVRLRERDAVRRVAAIERALAARAQGGTLRETARAAGVDISTLCRWQNQDPWLKRSLARFRCRKQGRLETLPAHRLCPACGRLAQVRCAHFGRRFWRCSSWPACPWASWQPRHPEDCPACGRPRYWSRYGRKVRCPACEQGSG
jgi:hypothetical protein